MVYDRPDFPLGSRLNLLNLQHCRSKDKASPTVALQQARNSILSQVTWEAAHKFNNYSLAAGDLDLKAVAQKISAVKKVPVYCHGVSCKCYSKLVHGKSVGQTLPCYVESLSIYPQIRVSLRAVSIESSGGTFTLKKKKKKKDSFPLKASTQLLHFFNLPPLPWKLMKLNGSPGDCTLCLQRNYFHLCEKVYKYWQRRSTERSDILPSQVWNLIIHASDCYKNHLKRQSLSK